MPWLQSRSSGASELANGAPAHYDVDVAPSAKTMNAANTSTPTPVQMMSLGRLRGSRTIRMMYRPGFRSGACAGAAESPIGVVRSLGSTASLLPRSRARENRAIRARFSSCSS